MSTLSLTDSFSSLCGELCHALSLLSDSLSSPCNGCIAHISECHRRATSLTADTHAYLFSAFCPPLERAPSMLLCERLHAAVGAVFETGLYLTDQNTPDSHRTAELQSLCRMAEQLRGTVLTLPRLTKGSHPPPPPDTFRFHSEHTKARAAHALHVIHNDKSEAERSLSRALQRLSTSLCDAHAALLLLVAQSI
jgi:hypothetical protein